MPGMIRRSTIVASTLALAACGAPAPVARPDALPEAPPGHPPPETPAALLSAPFVRERALPAILPRPRPVPHYKPPTQYPYDVPATPTAAPGEAAGLVLERGMPARGIEISLIGPDSRTVTTDGDGLWRVANLAEGAYWLHYYNDSDRRRIGYWKTPSRYVDSLEGASFPAFDVHLQGFTDDPPNGAGVDLPAAFRWEPYALASSYRFRIHDKPGPGGKPLFVSSALPGSQTTYSYDGHALEGGNLKPGHYLWGVWWDAGDAGEGGNLYQEIRIYAGRSGLQARRQ